MLQIRHDVVAAEDLGVVAKTSAASELVIKGGNIRTFRDTSSRRGGKHIGSPLAESTTCLTLGAKAEERGFFWSKEGQLVREILAVGDSGTRAELGLGRIWLIGIRNTHNSDLIKIILT